MKDFAIKWSPPKPHANDTITDPGCTGHYIYALTTIFNSIYPPANPIKVKLPNYSTMESTKQDQFPLQSLSKQAKHAEIFSPLHSSLISIGDVFNDA